MTDALEVLRSAIARQAPAMVTLTPGVASLVADELTAHRACLSARADRGVTNDQWHGLWKARGAAVAASKAGA